jgi:hypothetical protein
MARPPKNLEEASMSPFARRVVLVATLIASPLACGKNSSSNSPSPADAGGKAGTGGTGGSGGSTSPGGTGGSTPQGGTGGTADASVFMPGTIVRYDASAAGMAPKDCRGLRNCVHACDKDTACASKCVSQAPAAAQSQYRMIQTCSAQACPDKDLSCRCENECQGGGQCADLVDECNQGNPDDFCDPMGADCGL